MQPDTVSRVRAHPSFIELERSRGTFGRVLCGLMLVIYFGFILLVAFAHDLVATPLGTGLTLAFPLGLGVIVAAIVITGLYVARANGQYDRLTARVRQDVP